MEIKKKSLMAGSLIAGALFTATALNANAANPFHFNTLGSGETVRTRLMAGHTDARHIELKCGEKGKKMDSTMSKKGKEGKCGEGKCGEKKKDMKKQMKSKPKEGKSGGN